MNAVTQGYQGGLTALDAPFGGFFHKVWNYFDGMFNPTTPGLSAPPSPPNPSAVAGASLQQTLGQEQQQYTASSLLNGGGGIPFSGSPVTASNVLRAGTR